MRRWNGWGDDTVDYPLPDTARGYLGELLGGGARTPEAKLADVLRQVPVSRLSAHPMFDTSAEVRLRHARGQSLSDWIELKSGRVSTFPDAVAFPETSEDVAALLAHAASVGAAVIPYGGGTSVAGHVNPRPEDPPVITVALQRLSRLLRWDGTSRLATFGAGVKGPDLEAVLRNLGMTLGHFPQSFELSTLGGWVVTRSSGQQSLGYGRIERLFAGGRLQSPRGRLDLLPLPASAGGPDLREQVLGSEGRLGVLTEATVRVSRLPEREEFHAFFVPDWESGVTALRTLVQDRVPLSMLRLSSATETDTLLRLGPASKTAWLRRWLSWRGAGEKPCLVQMGASGSDTLVSHALGEAEVVMRRQRGVSVGRALEQAFRKGRFGTPYLRNTLWDAGYAVDTLETATTWTGLTALREGVERALLATLGAEARVHVYTHVSHVYTDGGSLYTTYLFPRAQDEQETHARWRRLKAAASRAIVAGRGTISHQHGVGVDHAPYLVGEKTPLGLEMVRDTCRRLDPAGIMNPGKLVERGT